MKLKLGHLRQSSLLVFPSLWYETFGLTLFESLSFGVPVLFSSSVAISEKGDKWTLENSFPFGSESDLSNAIRRRLCLPRYEYERLPISFSSNSIEGNLAALRTIYADGTGVF